MPEYSGTPLVRKLGIKPGHRVAALHAPSDFASSLGPLPPDTAWAETLDAPPADAGGPRRFDLVIWFGTTREGLRAIVRDARPLLHPAGGLWIAWPKRASGLTSEITDDLVREIALPTGLVDNKVCSVDATWTGLRLVVRRELRG